MRLLLFVTVLAALTTVAGQAQTPSPSAAPSPTTANPDLTTLGRATVDTMLRGGKADASSFSQTFLTQVPITKVDGVLAQLADALGQYQTIDGTGGDYTAHFQKGTVEVLVHLDGNNKIDGLFFKPPKMAQP